MITPAPTTSTGLKTALGAAGQRAQFNRDEFLKILTSEISHQNPLEPMSNENFLGQLAQLQQLETSAALEDSITNLLKFQELGAASTLLGKTVRAANDQGETLTGPVEKVVVQNGKVRLVINGDTAALSTVQEIAS